MVRNHSYLCKKEFHRYISIIVKWKNHKDDYIKQMKLVVNIVYKIYNYKF